MYVHLIFGLASWELGELAAPLLISVGFAPVAAGKVGDEQA